MMELDPKGVEAAAKAIAVSRGLDPGTLFEVHMFYGNEPFDCEDERGLKFTFAWRKYVDNASAAITAYLSVSPLSGDGWQAIETAPKDGSTIILGGSTWSYPGFWMDDQKRNHFGLTGFFDLDDDVLTARPHNAATHWRPLPPPPTDEVK